MAKLRNDSRLSRNTMMPKSRLATGVITFLLGMATGSLVLLSEMGSVGNVLKDFQVARTINVQQVADTVEDSANIPEKADNSQPLDAPVTQDGVQFILMVGLEGTGHHLMQQLVSNSPGRQQAMKLGIDPIYTKKLTGQLANYQTNVGLWNAHCKEGGEVNVLEIEEAVVQHFSKIRQMVHDARQSGRLTDSMLRIPINTNPGVEYMKFGMQSFPNFEGPCRKLNYPSLDLLYTACQKAQVDCRHVYMYRDPKQVLASTTIKRDYNPDGKLAAIHMYKTLLHVIASEMATYRSRTLACIGFYDTSLMDHWKETVRQLWGWTNQKEYDTLLKRLYKAPSDKEIGSDWLPKEMAPYMKVLEDAHQDTLDVCRSGPYQLESAVQIPSTSGQ